MPNDKTGTWKITAPAPLVAGACVCALIFWLNLRYMAPTVTAGDSAELSAVQSTLGIAHSPGYPLFAAAGRMFSAIVPAGNAAYKTNLFSVLLSACAAALLYTILFRWSRSVWLAMAGTLFTLSARSVREQYLATEVFALNSVVFLALILIAAEVCRTDELRRVSVRLFYLASFILGLAMGNQHTIILLVPSFAALAVGYSVRAFLAGECSGCDGLKMLACWHFVLRRGSAFMCICRCDRGASRFWIGRTLRRLNGFGLC